MKQTLYLLQQPTVVVTLLSPSPTASRRMLQRLQRWTSQPQQQQTILTAKSAANDALNQTIVSNALLRLISPHMKLNSVALSVGSHTETRTVIHCLSVDDGGKENSSKINGMELFAIQSLTPKTDLLQEARDRLAEKLMKRATTSPFETLRTLGSALVGRRATRHYLPQHHEYLPLLDFDEEVTLTRSSVESFNGWKSGELKEIVIPSHWSDAYADKRTLFTTLQDSPHLTRPVTGLYQLPASRVCIRPLPMAKEDRTVPPPSLIFHSEDLDDVGVRNADDVTTKVVKIGYTGRTARGQLMLLDGISESAGVDVRLCSASKPSSMFAEAQESLMAGSLSELQSKHVMTNHSPKDSSATTRESDPNTNKMDCWVEFRANIRNPKGFLPRQQQASPKSA